MKPYLHDDLANRGAISSHVEENSGSHFAKVIDKSELEIRVRGCFILNRGQSDESAALQAGTKTDNASDPRRLQKGVSASEPRGLRMPDYKVQRAEEAVL